MGKWPSFNTKQIAVFVPKTASYWNSKSCRKSPGFPRSSGSRRERGKQCEHEGGVCGKQVIIYESKLVCTKREREHERNLVCAENRVVGGVRDGFCVQSTALSI